MIMRIKKCCSYRKDYLNYSFVSDAGKLSHDVVDICEKLSPEAYVIEIFMRDPLNTTVFSHMPFIGTNGNFSYFKVGNIEFIRSINIENIRHMQIYAFSQENLSKMLLKQSWLLNHSLFIVAFGNYLDVCDLLICKKYYTKQTTDTLY